MDDLLVTRCRHNETGQVADIPTAALEGWQKLGWEPESDSRSLADVRVEEHAAEAAAQAVAEEVPDLTVAQVLDEVGDDPEKAAAALEAELAREKPRSTLVDRLTQKAGQPGDSEGN